MLIFLPPACVFRGWFGRKAGSAGKAGLTILSFDGVIPPTSNALFFQGIMSTSTKKGGIYHGKRCPSPGARVPFVGILCPGMAALLGVRPEDDNVKVKP